MLLLVKPMVSVEESLVDEDVGNVVAVSTSAELEATGLEALRMAAN